MRNNKSTLWLILLAVSLPAACIKEEDGKRGGECEQRIVFYSLDREANNVLHANVPAGDLYAFSSTGALVQTWAQNPVPDLYTLPLPAGQYDVVFVGNALANTRYNRPVTRGTLPGGSLIVIPNDANYYKQADDVHVGNLLAYTINPNYHSRVDSLHIKRMVGMVSVRIQTLGLSAAAFRAEMIIHGVASGVDFYQHPIPSSVDVIEYGEIVNEKISINAKCFPSIEPLTVTVRIIDKNTGNTVSIAEKTVEEMLTRNKQIIIDYNFQGGNLVELDVVVKDWDRNTDVDSGNAQ